MPLGTQNLLLTFLIAAAGCVGYQFRGLAGAARRARTMEPPAGRSAVAFEAWCWIPACWTARFAVWASRHDSGQ